MEKGERFVEKGARDLARRIVMCEPNRIQHPGDLLSVPAVVADANRDSAGSIPRKRNRNVRGTTGTS